MKLQKENKFKIVHLYPKELNLYGDTGNIKYLQNFLHNLSIDSEVVNVGLNKKIPSDANFIFAGGGPDSLQNKIYEDFLIRKDFLINYIESGNPALFICGSFQLLGSYYLTSENKKIKGLDIFNFSTKSPKNQSNRITGNAVLTKNFKTSFSFSDKVVGFQNHNGRTFLEEDKPLGITHNPKLGNNDIDNTEGLIYKKTIGSYLHGPILVKNPHIVHFLLEYYLKSKEVNVKKFYSEYTSHFNLLS